jgi:hypothetical protein
MMDGIDILGTPLSEERIEKAALSIARCRTWEDLPLPPSSGDHTRYVPAMIAYYRRVARRALEAYQSNQVVMT